MAVKPVITLNVVSYLQIRSVGSHSTSGREKEGKEGKEVKGVRRRRTTQLLYDLRNRRRYWELKEEAEDRKKVEMTVYQSNLSIFHKSLDPLIRSILNNYNN